MILKLIIGIYVLSMLSGIVDEVTKHGGGQRRQTDVHPDESNQKKDNTLKYIAGAVALHEYEKHKEEQKQQDSFKDDNYYWNDDLFDDDGNYFEDRKD